MRGSGFAGRRTLPKLSRVPARVGPEGKNAFQKNPIARSNLLHVDWCFPEVNPYPRRSWAPTFNCGAVERAPSLGSI